MSEETDSAATLRTVLTRLRTIASRVEPALKYAVSELARVALDTLTFAKLSAGGAGIVKLPGVSAASLLTGMGVRTLRPVVGPTSSTLPHLKLEHTEVIACERVHRNVTVLAVKIGGVRRKVAAESRRHGVEGGGSIIAGD